MNEWLAIFIAFGIVIAVAMIASAVQLKHRVQTKVLPSAVTAITQFGELAEFAKQHHERIGEYLRANWSGRPGDLEGVLKSLVDQLEGDARATGLNVDRDTLKTLVATSLRSHRIAKANDVGNALERVA